MITADIADIASDNVSCTKKNKGYLIRDIINID